MKKTILSLLIALMATTGAWAQIDVTDFVLNLGDEQTTGVALIDNGKLIIDNSAGANGQRSLVNGTTCRAAASNGQWSSQRHTLKERMFNVQC